MTYKIDDIKRMISLKIVIPIETECVSKFEDIIKMYYSEICTNGKEYIITQMDENDFNIMDLELKKIDKNYKTHDKKVRTKEEWLEELEEHNTNNENYW